MYPNVHSSIIYSNQDIEAIQKSIDRWMDKEVVAHIYNGVLLRSKLIIVKWMNLEPVIQSEGSQKQTQISYINAYL